MKPAAICTTILGIDRLGAIIDQLSAPQIKAVLRSGNIKVKLPASAVSHAKRRQLWSARILSTINDGNDDTDSELLQQWLLGHQRQMLIDYLDDLGVSHRAGETDETFLVGASAAKAREAGTRLAQRYAPEEARAYLQYIAFQQDTDVFDGWAPGESTTAAPVAAETTATDSAMPPSGEQS